MYRFFVEADQITEDPNGEKYVLISGSDYNHMHNVLRMKPGEKVYISDGVDCEYAGQIEGYEDGNARVGSLTLMDVKRELSSDIYLFQGLAKGEKLELVIQKAVELGARGIIPVNMERSVVKLDEKKAKSRRERWQQIALGAAKQSKRMIIPEVYPVMSMKEALSFAESLDICLMPWECAGGMEASRKIFMDICPGQSVGVLIGPEGGISEAEAALAESKGFVPVTLGNRILRTETAAIYCLSVLEFLLEGKE